MRTALLALLLLSFCTLPALAQDATTPRISVTGKAITKVVPNQMRWQIAIRVEGKELSKAAELHTKTVNTLLEFLDDEDIPEDQVQTTHMSFGEKWANGKTSFGRTKTGYQATSQVVFTISDFDQYLPLWTGLAHIDGINVNSVLFDHSDRNELREKTRIKALLAAKRKAKAMAETLDAQIGKPLLIQEGASPQPYAARGANAMVAADFASGSNDGLAVGKIKIQETVTTVFELISSK